MKNPMVLESILLTQRKFLSNKASWKATKMIEVISAVTTVGSLLVAFLSFSNRIREKEEEDEKRVVRLEEEVHGMEKRVFQLKEAMSHRLEGMERMIQALVISSRKGQEKE